MESAIKKNILKRYVFTLLSSIKLKDIWESVRLSLLHFSFQEFEKVTLVYEKFCLTNEYILGISPRH